MLPITSLSVVCASDPGSHIVARSTSATPSSERHERPRPVPLSDRPGKNSCVDAWSRARRPRRCAARTDRRRRQASSRRSLLGGFIIPSAATPPRPHRADHVARNRDGAAVHPGREVVSAAKECADTRRRSYHLLVGPLISEELLGPDHEREVGACSWPCIPNEVRVSGSTPCWRAPSRGIEPNGLTPAGPGAELVGMALGARPAVNVPSPAGREAQRDGAAGRACGPHRVIDEIDSVSTSTLSGGGPRSSQIAAQGRRGEPLGVLAITHTPAAVGAAADRVHVLRDGRVVLSGGPSWPTSWNRPGTRAPAAGSSAVTAPGSASRNRRPFDLRMIPELQGPIRPGSTLTLPDTEEPPRIRAPSSRPPPVRGRCPNGLGQAERCWSGRGPSRPPARDGEGRCPRPGSELPPSRPRCGGAAAAVADAVHGQRRRELGAGVALPATLTRGATPVVSPPVSRGCRSQVSEVRQRCHDPGVMPLTVPRHTG